MEEDKNIQELLVSQGNRKWYEIALGSIFYAIIIFCILKMIYYIIIYPEFNFALILFFATLKTTVFLLPFGLGFTTVKSILINIKTNKLVTIYSVGLFNYKYNSEIPDLDYVSVFKNQKEEFEVNLWYSKNKHYKMYIYETIEEAFLFGKTISNRLNIDLLDATEKGNSKWIDKAIL